MSYDLSHLAPVWSRITDLVIERGQGCCVYTCDGTEYLDCTSGIGVTNTGHCHPKVVRAIQEQAAKIIHAQVNCHFHEPLIELSHALGQIVPAPLDTFFFSNSGAEAIEGAVKLARHATGRTNVIVFQGGFHGRTGQAMAMTTAKTVYRVRYQPLPSGIFVAPFPFSYRYGTSEEEASRWALNELDLLLHTQTAPAETAAIVIEPVLGEGGYIPAPKPFLQGLRKVCDEHGILLVLDEVQTGFGRTGKYFAHEHAAIHADVMVLAKGLASGFPLSCVASTRRLMQAWEVGTHGGTYGGNPMGCAAALATIRVLQEEGLVDNAARRGKQLMEGLKSLQARFPVIGDVRGMGLMVGCEFTHPDTGQPDPQTMKKVVQAAFQREKLLLLTCGAYANTIRWIPPLVISQQLVDDALARFERALAASTKPLLAA